MATQARPREPETRKPKPDGRLDPVRSPAGVERYVQTRLERELEAMDASILYWLRARWRAVEPITVANDADPVRELKALLRKRGQMWGRKWRDMAEALAAELTGRTRGHVDRALEKMLRDNGVTIRFRMSAAMRQTVNAGLAQQVELITNLGAQHVAAVEGYVMRSLQTGRDLHQLSNDLEHGLGVSRRRAEFLARDQTNKATATMARTRALELGCTEGEWLHSAGGRVPRPSHVAFSRKRYDLAKGAFLDEVWTWPGVEPNCRCVSRPILPTLGAKR